MAKLFQWLLVCSTIFLIGETSVAMNPSQTDIETLIAKVAQLDSRVKELEQQMKVVQPNEKSTVLNDQPTVRTNQIYRTCHELRSTDPTLASGVYKIDPDGENIGDNPIDVYCDMSTGATSVPHDTETQANVGHCADPGCYSKAVTYTASKNQMKALADISTECHQRIRYDCNYAPFEVSGIAYGWWNDRNGIAKYFWSGSNTSVHTCQCGIDRSCIDSSTSCNCDALLPIDLADEGIITDKNLLPVSRLNFGRTQLSSSSGAHTLGRFTCSGQFIFAGMPTTCADLALIGHTLSGFYSVKGKTSSSNQVETIYCNFNKFPSESGYETRIGFSELKSSPVYFSVKRDESTATLLNGIVNYQVEQLNIGRAMDLASGKFTAPRDGTYHFGFSGLAKFTTTASNCYLRIRLTTSYNRVLGEAFFYSTLASGDLYSSATLEANAHLTAGEQVYIYIYDAINAYLYEDFTSTNFNQFSGWLLQEDLLL